MPSLFVPRGRARGTFAERGCSLRPNLAHQTVALVRASVEVHVPSCRLPCTQRVSHGLALRKSDWQRLDGVMAKRLDAPYRAGERTMIKVKRPTRRRVPQTAPARWPACPGQ